MRQWNGSALHRVMAFRLFGTKTLLKNVHPFSIEPLETNFSDISTKNTINSLLKMYLKVLSATYRQFRSSLYVLKSFCIFLVRQNMKIDDNVVRWDAKTTRQFFYILYLSLSKRKTISFIWNWCNHRCPLHTKHSHSWHTYTRLLWKWRYKNHWI